MVKEMFRTGRFYSENISYNMYHDEYPPFMQTFEYLWCLTAGRYTEMNVTMAVGVFGGSLTVPVLTEYFEEKKSLFHKLFISCCVIFILFELILLFDTYGTFVTIYLDITVALMYAYIISMLQKTDTALSFDFFAAMLASACIVLIKQISIVFILLAMIFCILKPVLDTKNKNISLLLRQGMTQCAAIAAAALLSHIIWNRYAEPFKSNAQFDLNRIDLTAFLGILSGKGTLEQNFYVSNYLSSLAVRNITASSIGLSYVSACILGLILLYFIYYFAKDIFTKRHLLVYSLLFSAGSIGFALTLFILYIFCFSEREMLSLASFDRYVDTYLLGEYLVLVSLSANVLWKKNIDLSVRRQNLIAVIGIGLLVLSPQKFKQIIPQCIYGEPGEEYLLRAQLIESYVQPGAKIFVVSSDNAENIAFVNYYMNNCYVSNNMVKSAEITPEQEEYWTWAKEVMKISDYFYIVDMEDYANSAFADHTNGIKLKNETIYMISHSGNDFKIVPCS